MLSELHSATVGAALYFAFMFFNNIKNELSDTMVLYPMFVGPSGLTVSSVRSS